ncbi:helix-turn-helix domain-containing protein [Gelidibacter salicanalis]|uniref:Helix-turn-helix transcriptional regulator n=1 Tax=Gelidibacter salicanalis TaxID=291193 RepID=A0A934NCR6_9FLAO|nr:helix-turn-helix transcriptional regulator [Gelidibacter salicanalis]MBJ7880980.1 hypothetical protein [Gelidibacter salicanalis]
MINNKVRNRIKEVAKLKGVNNKLIAVLLDVHHTTVSQWMNNVYQPNNEHTNKLIELLEVGYHDLIINEESPVDTGLGKVLQNEFDNLTKTKNLPLKVTIVNKKTGKEVTVYNPEIVKVLEDLGKEHKKRNG